MFLSVLLYFYLPGPTQGYFETNMFVRRSVLNDGGQDSVIKGFTIYVLWYSCAHMTN